MGKLHKATATPHKTHPSQLTTLCGRNANTEVLNIGKGDIGVLAITDTDIKRMRRQTSRGTASNALYYGIDCRRCLNTMFKRGELVEVD